MKQDDKHVPPTHQQEAALFTARAKQQKRHKRALKITHTHRKKKKKEHLGTHTSESKNEEEKKKKTTYMIQSNSKKRANTENRFGRPCVLNSVKTLWRIAPSRKKKRTRLHDGYLHLISSFFLSLLVFAFLPSFR